MLVPVVADTAMIIVETLRRDGETMRRGGYGVEKIMKGTRIVSFHETIQRLRTFLVLPRHDVLQGSDGSALVRHITGADIQRVLPDEIRVGETTFDS